MSFDGSYCSSRSGVGIIFKIPKEIIHPHTIKLEFPCMNNEAKYEELIQWMNLAIQMKIKHLIITRDSEHVKNTSGKNII